MFWFTTTGWMMWNFLVSVLLTDAAIVLYDGNPGAPDLDRLWDLAEESRMTCFGTSASYIASCMKAGIEPAVGRDLSALRAGGSTGSPLAPEGFEWVYEQLGKETWLFSTSGGTDMMASTSPFWSSVVSRGGVEPKSCMPLRMSSPPSCSCAMTPKIAVLVPWRP